MLCYDMLCYIILQRSTVIDSIHVDLRMNTDSLPPLKSALLKSTPDNSNKTIDDDDDSNGSSSSDDGDKVTNDTRIPLVELMSQSSSSLLSTTIAAAAAESPLTKLYSSSLDNNNNNNNNNNSSSSSSSSSKKKNIVFTPRSFGRLSRDSKDHHDNFLLDRTTPFKQISSDHGYSEAHKAISHNFQIEQIRWKKIRKETNVPKGYINKFVGMANEAQGHTYDFKPNSIYQYVKSGKAGITPVRVPNKFKKRKQDNEKENNSVRVDGNKRAKKKEKPKAIIPTIHTNESVRLLQSSSSSSSSILSPHCSPYRITNSNSNNTNNDTNTSTNNNNNNNNNNNSTYDMDCPTINTAICLFQQLSPPSVTNRCIGIRFDKSSAQGHKVKFVMTNLRRKQLIEVENCTNIFNINSSNNKNNERIPYNDVLDEYFLNESKYNIFYEGNEIVFYSTHCHQSSVSSVNISTRCVPCNELRSKIYQTIKYAEPLGYDGNPIHEKTKIELICSHPFSAEKRLRHEINEKKKVRREIMKLKLENAKIQSELLECKAGSTFEGGVIGAFKGANQNFDSYLSSRSDIDGEESGRLKDLWEVAFEHLMKMKEKQSRLGKAKMKYGIKFHPALLKFAILILAKTSQSAYIALQPALQLPDISYLLRLQKKNAGGQNERQTSFGVLIESCKIMGKKFDDAGIHDSELRKVLVSFDSMKCVQQINCDLHNGPVGVDAHLNFNVIANKFRNMVSHDSVVLCYRLIVLLY